MNIVVKTEKRQGLGTNASRRLRAQGEAGHRLSLMREVQQRIHPVFQCLVRLLRSGGKSADSRSGGN
ncbi:MAG: hypothetical protein HGA24_03270 [Candidatus Aminicenantes bacterium]|nr:hypothetical protein [Candidatus Aminicenantes bacterium]